MIYINEKKDFKHMTLEEKKMQYKQNLKEGKRKHTTIDTIKVGSKSALYVSNKNKNLYDWAVNG